jgi:hypothetical protein
MPEPSGNTRIWPVLVGTTAAILLAAVCTMHLQVVLGVDSGPESALPVPAVWAIIALLGLNAAIAWLRRGRPLLSRSQLVLIACGVLMAGPLLTQGFWLRYIGTVTSLPRENQFWLIDALPDKLWPHGEDLLEGSLGEPRPVSVGQPLVLRIPSGDGGAVAGAPYLLSLLACTEELPSGSFLTCSLVGEGVPREAFRLDRPSRPDRIRGDGFQRLGAYGVRMPTPSADAIELRLQLHGPGRILVSNPRLMSVAAIEFALRGRRLVEAEAYAALPPAQQAGAIPISSVSASFAGAAFVAGGGVPWGEWAVCLSAWGGFLVLLIGAILGLSLLLHRQWTEAERLPMPLARSTGLLLGLEAVSLRQSRWFWTGLIAASVWCQARYWSVHINALPDPSIALGLGQYVTDPAWNKMFQVVFTVNALFLGLALFFELNVLASLLVGFWLYRSLLWFGDVSGAATTPGFPWRHELCLGAYVAYFAVIILLARRHLTESVRRAVVGGWSRLPGEPASPRAAILLLVGSCAGGLVWAWWVGLGLAGFAIVFAAFVVVGTVAARLRAECGLLFGYFSPFTFAIVLGALGGIPVFGPQVVFFALTASMWMATTTMLVPGMAVDAAELGRREGAGQGWSIGLPLLAVALGVLLGGWALLSLSYGQGADNLRYAWAYDTKLWYFFDFSNEVSALGDSGRGLAYSPWGVSLGAGATAVVAALRVFCAGFWFHPVGLLMGSTFAMDAIWGSCLVALVLRFAVVRMAGAEAVRNHLLPLGLGIFLAGCFTVLTAFIHGSVLQAGSGFTSLGLGGQAMP